jgi:hypothetical protein
MRRKFISTSLCILQINDEKRPCVLSSSLIMRSATSLENNMVAKNATMRMIRTII